jgi:hypothetical protein
MLSVVLAFVVNFDVAFIVTEGVVIVVAVVTEGVN